MRRQDLDRQRSQREHEASQLAGMRALGIYDQVVSAELTEWNQDPELLSWLANLR